MKLLSKVALALCAVAMPIMATTTVSAKEVDLTVASTSVMADTVEEHVVNATKNGRTYDTDGIYRYYVNGVVQKGWIEHTDASKGTIWYYGEADGSLVKGWKKLGGKWYYFDYLHRMLSDQFENIDGKKYYFNSNGSLATGWVENGDNWSYAKADGSLAKDEWLCIKKKWYYFNYYTMVVGYDTEDYYGQEYYNGRVRIDGKYYWFNRDGSMATGWVLAHCSAGYDTWMYAKKSGELVESGWECIGGKWYYFDYYEMMYGGTITVDGQVYYLDDNGVMVSNNWVEVKLSGGGYGWVYAKKSGVLAKSEWLCINKKWYYFGSGNIMYNNGVYEIDGDYYGFGSDGTMKTGWIYATLTDGTMGWGYATSDGKLVRNQTIKIDGKYYTFNKYGVLQD